MSEGKYPFEDAPDAKNSFSNVAQEQNETQENIQQNITADEPTLEYRPPTPEFGFESFQSIQTAPDVLGTIDAQKEILSENKSQDNQHSNDHFLSNSIQTDVRLSEAWDKAQSSDSILDEGAEQ